MISRIRKIIEEQGLSVRAFALGCGIPQPTLDNQLKNKRELSLSTITKILLAYPNVSAEWLLRGSGPMYVSDINNHNTDRLSKLISTIGELQSIIEEKQQIIDELVRENTNLKKLKR